MTTNNHASQNEKLKAALDYQAKGYSVIPIGHKKKPIIKWKRYQKQIASPEEIQQWFREYPMMDIGIVTGELSGLVVVDVESGGSIEGLSDTVIAQTGGGGFHYYYLHPGRHIKNKVRLREKMDIRGDGGYVVAPPSGHPSGGFYSWSSSLLDTDMVDLPNWITNALIDAKTQNWDSILITEVSHGARNDTLTKVAGRIIAGLSFDRWGADGKLQIYEWNKKFCKPPLETAEVDKLINSVIRLKKEEINQKSTNQQSVKSDRFAIWKHEIGSKFSDLVIPAEIGLSVIAQLFIKDITNPFACVYVGPPSSGKTITLNFFDRFDGLTYATDKFSPAAFVSHAANVKREELSEIDLLPRIKNKAMLVRDMTTIFTLPDEKLRENLGILTRVLDGEGLQIDSGSRGQRGYQGKYVFMLLGATTDGSLTTRLWYILGSLGSRIFFVHMPEKDKSPEELAHQLGSVSYKEKEELCRIASYDFIKKLQKKYPDGVIWDKEKDSKKTKIFIAQVAKTLAKLRGIVTTETVSYDDDKKTTIKPVSIEEPDRINQLLYNFACGNSLVKGRNYITDDERGLIAYIAFQSVQDDRKKVFQALTKNKGVITTEEIESIMGKSKPIALLLMDTFRALGLCNIESVSEGKGRPQKILLLKEEFCFLI